MYLHQIVSHLLITSVLGGLLLQQNSNQGRYEPATNQTIEAADVPYRVRQATSAEITQARSLVDDSLRLVASFNEARFEYQARDAFGTMNRTIGRGKRRHRIQVPPLFEVTPELAAAAALVAEVDAVREHTAKIKFDKPSEHPQIPAMKFVSDSERTNQQVFWMDQLNHQGSWPWGNNPSYKVYRNVRDYGAVGDGLHDDTVAIIRALFDGRRCAERCNGDTRTNAIVYFPYGTYLVSGSIIAPFGTQMIGDATQWPTIKASASFIGLGMISTDEYVENGGIGIDKNAKEWYINTANFYRQIRNFDLDITRVKDEKVAAIHYQVAQATSLQNINFIMRIGSQQRGIWAENGSGGVMSDLTFFGGIGISGGAQQFTAQRLKFFNCQIAVHLNWDWAWTWKGIEVHDCSLGFQLGGEDGDGNVGSILIMDSAFYNTDTAIMTRPPSVFPGHGTTGITLENVIFNNVRAPVRDWLNKVYLSDQRVYLWSMGPVYSDQGERVFSLGSTSVMTRQGRMLGDNPLDLPSAPYFERAKPQYERLKHPDFVQVKDRGVRGDGITDDTKALQTVIDTFRKDRQNRVIYIDAGTYLLSDTITIPSGTRIVGEAWSQLVAYGPNFEDANKPRPLIRVGNPGDVGDVELQDLIFTTKGPTAGAVLVEWNIKAATPGSAAMWDCHVRVGGATGTMLTSATCPKTIGSDFWIAKCRAASLMLHITPRASAYIENFWAWLADHDIDDPDWTDDNNDMTQASVFAARGVLIESTDSTWLYGTASEHAVMYEYNFHRARNVFAAMLQTETPYYQPKPLPPAPFADSAHLFNGDPDFSSAANRGLPDDGAWGLVIRESSNIQIAGAGIYSWFSDYSQSCIDVHTCQNKIINIKGNSENVRIQNLITIGALTSISGDYQDVIALTNLAIIEHPSWSQISQFDAASPLVQDYISDDWDELGSSDDWYNDDETEGMAVMRVACNHPPFDSITEFSNSIDQQPSHCQAYYGLITLRKILDTALHDYDRIGPNYYDRAFKRYADASASNADQALRGFLQQRGDQYFTCKVREQSFCCAECQSRGKSERECRYCFSDGPCFSRRPNRLTDEGPWSLTGEEAEQLRRVNSTVEWTHARANGTGNYNYVSTDYHRYNSTGNYSLRVNDTISNWNLTRSPLEIAPPDNQYWRLQDQWIDEPCPPDTSKRGERSLAVDWRLRLDQERHFYEDVENAIGVKQHNIRFGEDGHGKWLNAPIAHDVKAGDIPNPKQMVEKAMRNGRKLSESLKWRILEVQNGVYSGDRWELLDAMTVPVLVIDSAVNAMKSIVATGEKLEIEEEKAIITGFAMGIMFFLPVAGEVIGSVGLTAGLPTVLSTIGSLGGLGLDIYTIVDDPANAALGILGLVLFPFDLALIAKAAGLSRGLKGRELTKLGTKVETGVVDMRKVTQVCRRRT